MYATRARTETGPPDPPFDAFEGVVSARVADQLTVPLATASAWPARRGGRARAGSRRALLAVCGVWFLRALLLIPFVLMAPEVVSAVAGRPDGVAHLSASTADVLGTSTLLIFVMMLAVTPINTMTGWRWHLILRRDYGIGMFAVATTDLTLAAITTGNTFPGGVLARVAGHTFLLAGLTSTLLLVPLVVTANRPAQRWLGGYWKTVQRLTYVVWVTVLVHLLFLFGVGTIFVYALAVSAPLALLRVPALRRRWHSARRDRTHRLVRAVAATTLVGIFLAGYVPLLHELVTKGSAAFVQNPSDD